jgi:hypothetical protein
MQTWIIGLTNATIVASCSLKREKGSNMDRYYLKCEFCERPMAVNLEVGNTIEEVAESTCPLCGEKALRIMGRVEKTNLVRSKVKAACDLRCTNAIGPKCDCVCVNANHGTHRLVRYDKVFCKLEVVEKDLLNNNEEYLARIRCMAAAKVDIKQRVLAFLDWKYGEVVRICKTGGYDWDTWKKFQTYCEFKKRIDKIEDLRSIQRKINQLVKLIPQIGSNLDYIEAVGLAKGLVK